MIQEAPERKDELREAQKQFGQAVLKKRRKALNLTRKEMAKKIDVDPSTIYRVEMEGQTPSREKADLYVSHYCLNSQQRNDFYFRYYGASVSWEDMQKDLEDLDKSLNDTELLITSNVIDKAIAWERIEYHSNTFRRKTASISTFVKEFRDIYLKVRNRLNKLRSDLGMPPLL